MFRKNVYILGAGFSAGAGAPVMWNFIEQAKLLREDPRLDLAAEDSRAFGRVFKRLAELRVAQSKMATDIDNIEHLFSLLDMDIEFGGNTKRELRQDLTFLILRTLEKTMRLENLPKFGFGLSIKREEGVGRTNLPAVVNYVEVFSALASRRWLSGPFGIPESGRCQDTIITMNYDCLVDDSLTGIGVPRELNLCKYKMSLLKLHGSANWFRCDSGKCAGKVIIAGGTPAKRLEYFYGQLCPQCGLNEVQPIIVPPTWAKGGQSGVLRSVWAEALRALREAGRIFIIGYSMPSTDAFFRYMLALALASNEVLDKVIVVNPSSEAQVTFEKLFQLQFRSRKLTPAKTTVHDYIASYALAKELGQIEHGFDSQLAKESGVTIGT
jgi:hypothetical protein